MNVIEHMGKLARKAKTFAPARTMFPAGHFYSPYPDLKDIESRKDSVFDRTKRDLPGIDMREAEQLELLSALSETYGSLPYPDDSGRLRFNLDNGPFPHCDAVVLYCMLGHLRPKRVIEVGSGFSSALLLDANELILGGGADLTFVEPYPALFRSLIKPADAGTFSLIPEPLSRVGNDTFASLERNDVLFIDSTHVSKAGSDVNQIFFEILPSLQVGTVIHIHDVFYPFEYPLKWVRETRAWNEDYLLRAFLYNNEAFEILFFNHFMGLHHADRIGESMPLANVRSGGSLWLRKVA